MADSNKPSEPKEEYVDFAPFFTFIGNVIMKTFNFIASIFNSLLNGLLNILLFFRKHWIKFVIAGIIGFVIGKTLDAVKDPTYSATMEVRPNMQSGRSLYKSISYYNQLAEKNDSVMLSNIFHITLSQAASLKSFEIEPIINKNQIISSFDTFKSTVDSTTAINLNLEDYQSNFADYHYSRHIITVSSSLNNVFNKLRNPIIDEISNNEFYKNQQDAEFEILDKDLDYLNTSLAKIDTLRKVYLETILLEAKKESGQGTNINMASTNNDNKEVDLFEKENTINGNLNEIIRERVRNKEIISVIYSFEVIGSENKPLHKHNSIRLSLIAIFLTLIFLIGKTLNEYLRKIEED